MVVAQPGYRHSDEKEYLKPTMRSEIHSLGSTIYEIVTGTMVHQGLEDYEIDRLVKEGKYPDVSSVPLGDIIAKCWDGSLGSAAEVSREIARSGLTSLSGNHK